MSKQFHQIGHKKALKLFVLGCFRRFHPADAYLPQSLAGGLVHASQAASVVSQHRRLRDAHLLSDARASARLLKTCDPIWLIESVLHVYPYLYGLLLSEPLSEGAQSNGNIHIMSQQELALRFVHPFFSYVQNKQSDACPEH
jgi:hypothetical protein